MKSSLASVVLVALCGCGLERIPYLGHQPYARPASKLSGALSLPGAKVVVTDADGKEITPFESTFTNGTYEVKLPSAKYANLVIISQAGDTSLRALLPAIGEESAVQIDVNERSTTEALITEARLSADSSTWKQVTPVVYVATRDLIRAAFDIPGPTQNLLQMVSRLVEKAGDPNAGGDPIFFSKPVLNMDFTTKTSALDKGWVERTRFDIDGDGRPNATTQVFDDLLSSVAQLYRPAGCPDPDRIRIVFTVDFNAGRKNGNCGVSDRFSWATDKPGKSMFFVGWVHKDSEIQDNLVTALLGNGIPNQVPMFDDGTNGDETPGDNIWTIYFDVPRNVRIGYKYTWGTRGALWTGSEEWPGNSRIIEAVDVNGDGLVYRRDVFGDEATNKDRNNLNTKGSGSVSWTTDLRGYGLEAREQKVDTDNDCIPDLWLLPKAIGPLTLACTG
jgi:hypothetical protein